MNDRELRMELLSLSEGDVDKAKAMYRWLTEPKEPVEPPKMPDGVIVFDSEIMAGDADALMAIAMKRLADRQNSPPVPPGAPTAEAAQN
jgi:hypothetical protein